MEGDEIRAELSGINLDEVEKPNNPELEEILDYYDCEEFLPLAQRIIWLSSLKEVLGHIPDDIPIDYEELKLLVVLHDEQNKKMAYENFKLRRESEAQQRVATTAAAGSKTGNVSIDGAVKSY